MGFCPLNPDTWTGQLCSQGIRRLVPVHVLLKTIHNCFSIKSDFWKLKKALLTRGTITGPSGIAVAYTVLARVAGETRIRTGQRGLVAVSTRWARKVFIITGPWNAKVVLSKNFLYAIMIVKTCKQPYWWHGELRHWLMTQQDCAMLKLHYTPF